MSRGGMSDEAYQFTGVPGQTQKSAKRTVPHIKVHVYIVQSIIK